jgi:hypothetical protein
MKTKFGWVEIDSVRYDHDVIIHADRTVTRRSKKPSKKLKETYGHTPLSEHELEFLDAEHPDCVYIGTGQYGDLPITPSAMAVLERYDLIIRPTPVILDLIEGDRRHFVAVLHVTC